MVHLRHESTAGCTDNWRAKSGSDIVRGARYAVFYQTISADRRLPMLLTITTTHTPATDLGYLLHKHPGRAQTFPLSSGQAHVFYPEASEARCTAVLLLDVDPIALVRGRRGVQEAESGLLTQYVNDRPYVASSFLSVAIARVFGAALAGHSAARPELAAHALPLRVRLTPLPCQGGEPMLRELFAPLGYTVSTTRHPLDAQYAAWGQSRYFTVTLERQCRLAELLAHLYVLIPVLDNEKHYWVGDAEVDKLLRHGTGWLAQHPAKETIATRYLKYQPRLAREALARLADDDDPDPEMTRTQQSDAETTLERPLRLQQLRIAAVIQVLIASGARRVLDLGCGEGQLLRELLRHRQFDEIVGLDASVRALDIAQTRLKLDQLAPQQRQTAGTRPDLPRPGGGHRVQPVRATLPGAQPPASRAVIRSACHQAPGPAASPVATWTPARGLPICLQARHA